MRIASVLCVYPQRINLALAEGAGYVYSCCIVLYWVRIVGVVRIQCIHSVLCCIGYVLLGRFGYIVFLVYYVVLRTYSLGGSDMAKIWHNIYTIPQPPPEHENTSEYNIIQCIHQIHKIQSKYGQNIFDKNIPQI